MDKLVAFVTVGTGCEHLEGPGIKKGGKKGLLREGGGVGLVVRQTGKKRVIVGQKGMVSCRIMKRRKGRLL